MILRVFLIWLMVNQMNDYFYSAFNEWEFPTYKIPYLIKLIDITIGIDEGLSFNSTEECKNWILQKTQKNWLRAQGTERWETKDDKCENLEVIEDLLIKLELTDSTSSQDYNPDNVMIMSAVEQVFEQRVDFFASEIEKGLTSKKVYLVGGLRRLTKETDRKAFEVFGEGGTESDMLRWVVENKKEHFPFLKDIDFVSSDTDYQIDDAGGKRRPNTYDTVVTWADEYDDGGSVLCISNQPYIEYQTEVIRSVIGSKRKLSGCGSKIKSVSRKSVILDSLARTIFVKNNSHKLG